MAISDFRKKKLLYVFSTFFGNTFVFFLPLFLCIKHKKVTSYQFHIIWCSYYLDVDNSGGIDDKEFSAAAEVKYQCLR